MVKPPIFQHGYGVPYKYPLPNQCGRVGCHNSNLQALEAARAGQLFELGKPEKNKMRKAMDVILLMATRNPANHLGWLKPYE